MIAAAIMLSAMNGGLSLANDTPPVSPVKLVFVHHSTGGNWLADPDPDHPHGGLGRELMDNNYFVSATNYGWGPGGIGDRTDIVDWPEWFLGPESNTVLSALYDESGQNIGSREDWFYFGHWPRLPSDPGGENRIVMFKSCFPNSDLYGNPEDPPAQEVNDEYTVANAKAVYARLLAYFATRQDKLFVVITAPPRAPAETDTVLAANARALNNWLVDDWLAGYPHRNVVVFDYFNVLTSNGGDPETSDVGWEEGNHHRMRGGSVQHLQTVPVNTSAYPSGDSHPTTAGQQKATQEFVPLLNTWFHCWDGSGDCPERRPAVINPVADIKANGSDAAVSITSGETLTVSLGMTPGTYEGHSADWWLLSYGETDAGTEWRSFTVPSGWVPGITRAVEGPVVGFQDLQIPVDLGPGTYTFYFGADGKPDGLINVPVWYDFVPVVVRPAQDAATVRLLPGDLRYLGAFRLPPTSEGPEHVGWEWSSWSAAATYYSGGDPAGPDDHFPGSLFAIGNDQTQYVSEIGIPVPVNSRTKDVNELNTATTLQEFHDIKGDLYGDIEMPRVGLTYLPSQGDQEEGALHFCWAAHLDEQNTGPTHGWCGLDLSNPRPAGIWSIGGYANYLTAGYIFEIPAAWADVHTPGQLLATGRYRDGGQHSQGPALFAYGPWNSGNPPAPGAVLDATPILLYTSVYDEEQHTLDGYHHADEWNGGAWLTAGTRSAVIFAGTKGTGGFWYGCSDGTVWPEEPPFPPECAERGWWSTGLEGQIIFYDPEDLGAVARGEAEPWRPQPYAVMPLDDVLYGVDSARQKYHVSAVAFDRGHGRLFLFEPHADGEKPIVHVWAVE